VGCARNRVTGLIVRQVDEVKIRQATLRDLPGLTTSSAALLAEDGAARDHLRDSAWPKAHGAHWCADLIADANALILVAAAGEAVVGHLIATVTAASAMWIAPRAEIVSTFVCASWRGKAVGSRFVTDFVDWAKDRGALRLTVSTYASNTDAVRFYRRHGFVPLSVDSRSIYSRSDARREERWAQRPRSPGTRAPRPCTRTHPMAGRPRLRRPGGRRSRLARPTATGPTRPTTRRLRPSSSSAGSHPRRARVRRRRPRPVTGHRPAGSHGAGAVDLVLVIGSIFDELKTHQRGPRSSGARGRAGSRGLSVRARGAARADPRSHQRPRPGAAVGLAEG